MKTLLFIIITLLTISASLTTDPDVSHRRITGIVIDSMSGDPIIFSSVFTADRSVGTITDLEGKFAILVPDTCTMLMASYTGYALGHASIIGKDAIVINMHLSGMLERVMVTAYKVPLVEQDNTTQGGSKTAEQIRNLPSKNINSIAATTAGTARIEGGDINIRGSRRNATDYYVDGVRVNSNTVKGHKMNSNEPQLPVPNPVPVKANYPPFHTEDYGLIVENAFHDPVNAPLSTFSIDVDAASYSNMRRYLHAGSRPPMDAVRIEELINYFDYNYPEPLGADPVALISEIGVCPWNGDHLLVHVGLQARTIPVDDLPPSNLVFLVDVSGSMASENKLPLVKSSLKLLTETLRPQDRVAIVVYASATGLVLPSTAGSDQTRILDALESLQSGGSTAGAAGIQLAYKVARENFMSNGNNRVILTTDGDFNVGVSSDAELVRLIEQERESGVFLSVLGFGVGNYQDEKMQQLADKGNGNHSYVDNLAEAKKVFVNEFGGTLFTVAKDVKIQVEFNPEQVAQYRLIGYENRILQAADFNNDKKDAGEMGSGHSVTALYEIIPQGTLSLETAAVDPLKYQHSKSIRKNGFSTEWMTIKFRYKEPAGRVSKMIEHAIGGDAISFTATSDAFRWSAAVASFGMLLRNSEYAGNVTMNHVRDWARSAASNDAHGYKREFIGLLDVVREHNAEAKK